MRARRRPGSSPCPLDGNSHDNRGGLSRDETDYWLVCSKLDRDEQTQSGKC